MRHLAALRAVSRQNSPSIRNSRSRRMRVVWANLEKRTRTSLTLLPASFPGHWLINYKSFFKTNLSLATFFAYPNREKKQVKKIKAQVYCVVIFFAIAWSSLQAHSPLSTLCI